MPSLLGMTTSAFDPASRFRFIQFIPHFENAGWTVCHRPNRPDRLWSSTAPTRVVRGLHNRYGRLLMKMYRYGDIRSAAQFDVVFVNRDLAGKGTFFEGRLLRSNPRVIFDFDDAIFLGSNEPAVAWMCKHAAWVTPGNEFLATYARRFTERVTVVPTVIDTGTYSVRDYTSGGGDRPVRVGWSGSDQSIAFTLFPHLETIAAAQKQLDFELVIVTNTRPTLPVSDLRWSFIPWNAADEPAMSNWFDIGLMPLADDEFQKGKCGLKLLQYMAAGLPAIASPAGVNSEIVVHGSTGFLAGSPEEWMASLKTLASSRTLRAAMGQAGRDRCVSRYSIQTWLPTMLDIFDRVSQAAPSERQAGRNTAVARVCD
jgi:glycosyltransferase involved in cell wall biosynthesis